MACIAVAAVIIWSITGLHDLIHHARNTDARIGLSLVGSLPTDSPVVALAFTPDGKTLAVRLGTGVVQLRSAATGAVRATLGPADQSNPGASLAVSPDGKEIAIGINPAVGSSSSVEEISVATGKVTASVHVGEPEVYSVAFSPDGKSLAIAAGKQLVFWHWRFTPPLWCLPTSCPSRATRCTSASAQTASPGRRRQPGPGQALGRALGEVHQVNDGPLGLRDGAG